MGPIAGEDKSKSSRRRSRRAVAKEDPVARIEPVGAGLAHQGDRPIAVIAQFIVGTRQYCYSVIQVFASII